MSSPVVFAMTAAQRDCLAALAVQRASWPTFRPAIRAALARSGLVTSPESPALTVAGTAAAGLALILAKASPMPAVEVKS